MSVNIKENGQLVKTAGLNSQTVIIDNLTTQDATKALSAKQGYVLNQNKVDKVTGKGLSTNDYTNEDKAKVTSSDSKITNYEDRGYLGKNVLPLTLESVKAINTTGSWNDDAFTVAGVEWTPVEDSQGLLVGFKATRKSASSTQSDFRIPVTNNVNGMKVSGCPSNGSDSTYYMVTGTMSSRSATDYGNGATINGSTEFVVLRVASGYNANGVTFYPMIRDASSSATFVPYAKSNIELDATKIDKTASEIQTSDGQFTTVTGGLMQKCEVELEPIQDLHGYSKPWTGGSGKNLLPLVLADIKSNNTSGTWSGNTYTMNNGTFIVDTDNDGNVTGIRVGQKPTGSNMYLNLGNRMSLKNGTAYILNANGGDSTSYIVVEGEGASARAWGTTDTTYTPSADVTKYIQFVCRTDTTITASLKPIVRTSGNSTFEPYTNICPISGHTSVSVENRGKNKLNVDDVEIGTAWNGLSNSARARLIIPCKPSKTYILSMNGTNGLDGVYYEPSESIPPSGISGVTFPQQITTRSTDKYITLGFNKTNISKADIEALKLQLEEGSSATEYEPYNGYTHVIDLGDTYYGGTLDAVSGVLTVTHGFAEFDGSENGWALYEFSTGLYRAYISVADMKPLSADTQVANLVCNQYPTDSYSSPSTSGERITGRASSGQINVFETTQSTLANWKTYLESNNLQIAYELATPFTIQLDPQTLETLVGQNDVFAPLDGQSVEEVEFREVLAIDDVPKAIPYENVAPDMGTGEDRTYFRIKKYGRLVQLEFIQSNYWMVVEQQTKVVFGVLPDGYYDKQPSSMLHPDVEYEYPFVNETATNQYDNRKLFINMVNGEVYSVYQANDVIHPMGSIAYILDHD